jgi:hypothetical protein
MAFSDYYDYIKPVCMKLRFFWEKHLGNVKLCLGQAQQREKFSVKKAINISSYLAELNRKDDLEKETWTECYNKRQIYMTKPWCKKKQLTQVLTGGHRNKTPVR